MCSSHRVVVVRRDFFKSQLLVERAGRFHIVQSVQQHRGVARLARGIQNRLCQLAPQTKTAKSTAHIQALHFCCIRVVAGIERTQRTAARYRTIDAGQQQAATWRVVFARQAGQLGVKVLEGLIYVQAVGVFTKNQPGGLDVVCLGGDEQRDRNRFHGGKRGVRHTRSRKVQFSGHGVQANLRKPLTAPPTRLRLLQRLARRQRANGCVRHRVRRGWRRAVVCRPAPWGAPGCGA